jgi:uncharacterized protein YjbI with pentapeptide repeats
MKNIDNLIRKPFSLFFIWLLGIYILMFVLCLYVHVKESNIIAKRADNLLGKLTSENNSNWSKIATVQNMVRKTKPVFWELLKADNSLFGKRELYGVINRRLAMEIENNKNHLGGLILGMVHLEGASLAEADMHGAHLEKANLSGADLRGANLIAAELGSVNLSHANLKKAKLLSANLNGANLKVANLGNVQLHKARIQGADLRGASLAEADMHGAHLEKANLSGADLRGANLIAAELGSVNLSHANLKNAKLLSTNLNGAILKAANFENVVGLTCDQILSAVIDEETRLPEYILREESSDSEFQCRNLFDGKGLNLSKINLSNAYLPSVDLRESDLSQANFQNANLYSSKLNNANLSEANLNGANLIHAQLHKARIKGANLRGANLNRAVGLTCEQIKSAVIDEETQFPEYILREESSDSEFQCRNLLDGKGLNLSKINLSNAYLPSVDLRESDLSQANFQNAILYSSKLNNANLSEANLNGANLVYAQLHKARIKGANLRGANLNRANGLTCEQIKSAVIDEETRFPDYISLTGSPKSEYLCVDSP